MKFRNRQEKGQTEPESDRKLLGCTENGLTLSIDFQFIFFLSLFVSREFPSIKSHSAPVKAADCTSVDNTDKLYLILNNGLSQLERSAPISHYHK